MNWLSQITPVFTQHLDCVIISVIQTKGSTPCAVGNKVIFYQDQIKGSIGGGNLEYQALNYAKKLLTDKNNQVCSKQYPLGASLGQCCGGWVEVMFECLILSNKESYQKNAVWFTALTAQRYTNDWVIINTLQDDVVDTAAQMVNKVIYSKEQGLVGEVNRDIKAQLIKKAQQLLTRQSGDIDCQQYLSNQQTIKVYFEPYLLAQTQVVALFGAGHIGRALVGILAKLPVQVVWIDNRPQEFELHQNKYDNIKIVCDDFVAAIKNLPKYTYCLVITYSHQIDFDVCQTLLRTNNFSYLGLIGSVSKGKRFRKRLETRGVTQTLTKQLICPIGVKQSLLKSPMTVALVIAMDLLNFLENKQCNLNNHHD